MLINIHDANDNFFKISMQDLSIANAFFEQYLPAAIHQKFAWETLEAQPTNFVNPKLKSQRTDVLFKVLTKDSKETVYLLGHLEHQSSCEYDMAFRVLQYQMAIIEDYRKLHHNKPFPVIISFIIYNGRERYTAPTDIYQLFGEQAALARQFTFNGYQLIDLPQISDAVLTQSQKLGLMQWLMKHVRDQHFMQLGEQLATLLRYYFANDTNLNTKDEDYIVAAMHYLLAKSDINVNDQNTFFAIIKQNLPQTVGEKVMNLTQHWEQQGINKGILQGMEKGILQGMEKGKHEGIIEGERKTFLRRLQRRFKVSDHHLNLINIADEDMLLRWDENLDTATTLEQIFN